MLILTGFTKGQVSPFHVLPYTWYIYLLAIFGVLAIFIPYADRKLNKDPWNFQTNTPQSQSQDPLTYEES